MIMPVLIMGVLAPAAQALMENPAVKNLLGNLTTKVVEEAENQIDDLFDGDLAEEIQEAIGAYERAIAEERLEEALQKAADSLDEGDMYFLEEMVEAIKKLKNPSDELSVESSVEPEKIS